MFYILIIIIVDWGRFGEVEYGKFIIIYCLYIGNWRQCFSINIFGYFLENWGGFIYQELVEVYICGIVIFVGSCLGIVQMIGIIEFVVVKVIKIFELVCCGCSIIIVVNSSCCIGNDLIDVIQF